MTNNEIEVLQQTISNLEYEKHLMHAEIISLKKQLSAADNSSDMHYDWVLWYQEKMELIQRHTLNPITYPHVLSDSKDSEIKKYITDEDNWYERLRELIESEGDK